MRMFTLNNEGNLISYSEESFQENHREHDLEEILEKNPEYFFNDQKILIIGRQVTTNLNTFIDLLGINSSGNTVIIELKRDRTPRETLAQLLEYASFVDVLDYEQLNDIFKNYYNEETELEEYCKEYFSENNDEENISWNKNAILLIVGQSITKEIKQTSQFLRKKGIDVRCLEFKYFITKKREKIFTCDYVLGEEDIVKQKVQTSSLPKVDKQKFLEFTDEYGRGIFNSIFTYIQANNLLIRWGSKGFSVNYQDTAGFVALFFCYPPHCVFKQSIYTGYDEIDKKVKNAEGINKFYKTEIKKLDVFQNAQKSEKWIINRKYPQDKIEAFLIVIGKILEEIKNNGWKGEE